MGVISGVILSQLVYNSLLAHSAAEPGASAAGAVAQPVLALVGGYSVDFRPRRYQARDQYRGQFLWCLDGRSGR